MSSYTLCFIGFNDDFIYNEIAFDLWNKSNNKIEY